MTKLIPIRIDGIHCGFRFEYLGGPHGGKPADRATALQEGIHIAPEDAMTLLGFVDAFKVGIAAMRPDLATRAEIEESEAYRRALEAEL